MESQMEELKITQEEELPQEKKMMKTAFDLKDEGNMYFKQKDYKKAISKYSKVELYLKPLAPPKIDTADIDPMMGMMGGNMKQFSLSEEEIKACHELQATAFLNHAVCWHLQQEYERAEANAKKSLLYNKTIKAYYRLGQA